MITTLTISAVAIAFAVNVFSSATKRWIYPKFGKFGVQFAAFSVAALGAWYVLYGQNIESLAAFATATLATFSLAVTMYEVILSRLDWFKVTTPKVEAARAAEKQPV